MPNLDDASYEERALRTRQEASAYLLSAHALRIAPQTLASYAVSGKGPRFMLNGRSVLYATTDIDQWVRSRLLGPFRSTSEATLPMDTPNGHRQEKERRTDVAARRPNDDKRQRQIHEPTRQANASTIGAESGPTATADKDGNLNRNDRTGMADH